MKIILISLIAALWSVSVFSECGTGSCTGIQITRMYVTPSGKTVISTSGDESKLRCDAGTGNYISMDVDQKNYNSTYALLLTAHTTGDLISVRTTETGSCEILYIVSDKWL